MPFAAALGLTMTAKKVAKVEQRMMVGELDRPTPFTIKGVRWQGANKSDFKTGRLHSRVYLMLTQADLQSHKKPLSLSPSSGGVKC